MQDRNYLCMVIDVATDHNSNPTANIFICSVDVYIRLGLHLQSYDTTAHHVTFSIPYPTISQMFRSIRYMKQILAKDYPHIIYSFNGKCIMMPNFTPDTLCCMIRLIIRAIQQSLQVSEMHEPEVFFGIGNLDYVLSAPWRRLANEVSYTIYKCYNPPPPKNKTCCII